MANPSSGFQMKRVSGSVTVELTSPDNTNKLSLQVILSLTSALEQLRAEAESHRIDRLIITGNNRFFSAGADLKEIASLRGPEALEFSRAGQYLTDLISHFPAPVIAAIRGYCMGGGMDLALACQYRIATLNAMFGHRGAALGLMTGWGGTQRLPRLVGKARALQMFVLAEMIMAHEALEIGLVDRVDADPISAAMKQDSALISQHRG
jgi:enoyl-CoA hydratase/carnithine racemase